MLFNYLWNYMVLDGVRVSELIEYRDEVNKEHGGRAYNNNNHTDGRGAKPGPSENADMGRLNELGLDIYHGKENFGYIGGYEKLKESIKRDALYPLLHKDVYKDLERNTKVNDANSSPGAILFYGPSGTGKTLMAKVIANEEKISLVYLPLGKIFSKWMGESAQKLESAFNAVEAYSKQNGKTILFIDEIDALGSRSDGTQAADMDDRRVINTFLTKLDGFNSNVSDGNLVIIGSTNHHVALDKAIRSRFGSEIQFPLPAKEDRVKIMNLYAKHLSDSDLDSIASATEGFSGRDLKSIADMALRRAGQEIVEKNASYKVPPFSYYMEAAKTLSTKTKVVLTGDSARSYQ